MTDSQSAVLEFVEKATQKLFEVEITPRLKPVLSLISSIVRLANRYDDLTGDESDNVYYLCHRVNAYLNLEEEECIFDHSSLSEEKFRRLLWEFGEICEIGVDWIDDVTFRLPTRIESDLVESIGKIMLSCKSKKITINSLPYELASFISHLDNLCINVDSVSTFEMSMVVLHRAGIRSDQRIKFSNVDLCSPVHYLAIDLVSSFYQIQNVKKLKIIWESDTLSIKSVGVKGSIVFEISTSDEYPCVAALLDWVNIDCIKSVAIDTTANESENIRLANICSELIQTTNKLDTVTIYPHLTVECCCMHLANQSILRSLIVYNRQDISKIVSCVNSKTLFSFTVAGFHDEGVVFSRANGDLLKMMTFATLRSLRCLTLTLHADQNHDLLLDFLRTRPLLERLSLTNAPNSVPGLRGMQDFIIKAPNLLAVCLKFDVESNSSDLTDIFIALALQSDLTEVELLPVDDEDERMPELPKELVDSIVKQNETASYLSFTTFRGDIVPPDRCELLLNRNSSLELFEFCNRELNPTGELACRVIREESLWKHVNSEARDIILYSRILASFRRSESEHLRLPLEVVAFILTWSTAQSPLWIKKQLDVIIRCLRDRKTIGIVRSEVIQFDKNVLFVKCKRALSGLRKA